MPTGAATDAAAGVSAPVTPPDTVLFDLGNVLVDWSPRHLYCKLFPGRPREMAYFLDHVLNHDWIARHDAGHSLSGEIDRLGRAHPWYRAEIAAYRQRWRETVKGEITGAVRLLERLHTGGVALHALTNWSAETFPLAEARFPWLSLFGQITVSGRVGVIKPDPAIFDHAARTSPLSPETTLFVDDGERNIRAAAKLGFHVHLFRSPEALENCLTGHGLL